MDWSKFTPVVRQPKNEIIISVIAFFTISAIFAYGKYRCDHGDYKDPLLKKSKIWDLDGWSGLHFTHFMIGGYLAPNQWWLMTLIGIAWEIFEECYDRFKPGFLSAFGDCATTDEETGKWWFGRWSDLLMNASGMLLGIYLRQQNIHLPLLSSMCNMSDTLCKV